MAHPHSGARKGALSSQRGGFALGLIVGLLVGVGLSLAVALYVTKVPIPFIDKVPQRTAAQDAEEASRNKDWNPNAPLAGKSGNGPAAPAVPGAGPGAVLAPPAAPASQPSVVAPAASTGSATPAPVAPPIAAIGASRPSASARTGTDPLGYVVQIASYSRATEAEQQRTRLILAGLTDVKVVEFEQAGGKMYRVRLGPFKVREDADRAKDQAASAGFSDASVWRAGQ